MCATIKTINSADLISESRVDINDNFIALNSGKIEASTIDIDGTLASDSDTKIPSQKAVKTYADTKTTLNAVLNAIYPIGSIYFNAAVTTNPSTLLGFGTWTAWGTGQVPVGYNSSDTDFNTLEKTGGSKTTSISHTHTWNPRFTDTYGTSNGLQYGAGTANIPVNTQTTSAMSANSTPSIVQPYITVYMWKRTA